ncbi:MAG: MBL fold metallo-hydrolase, partial [Deltaproteobacteria bacterium]|nr:MBL fold metallo-hydrolase [Deltaproteobacteria bacterium]
MLLRQIFDPHLAQYAYLIGCQRTGEALIIDPERDIERYHKIANENGLQITAVTETHIHADFVSGCQEFAADPDLQVYLSAEGGPDWLYNWPRNRPNTHFVKHGSTFNVGKIKIEVIATPGHTPEHICFLITDCGAGADQPMALITGDFLFVGGVGRPDLLETAAGIANVMEASAYSLGQSLRTRLSPFSDFLQILPGHGAGSACGKSLGAVPISTLGYERAFNSSFKLALADPAVFVKDVLTGQPNPPLYFARMKQVNRDGIAVTGGAPLAPHISTKQFREFASDSTLSILDTREDRIAFDAAHVPHAIHAPLNTPFFFSSAGSYVTPNSKIILILENPEDADLAVKQLYRIGLDSILGWITVEEAAELATESIERIHFENFDTSVVANAEILDVRNTSEYDADHLPGARSTPYTRLAEHLDELPQNRRLYVHCAAGRRAAAACSFLKAKGY